MGEENGSLTLNQVLVEVGLTIWFVITFGVARGLGFQNFIKSCYKVGGFLRSIITGCYLRGIFRSALLKLAFRSKAIIFLFYNNQRNNCTKIMVRCRAKLFTRVLTYE